MKKKNNYQEYNVLIEYGNQFYKICKIIIKRNEGDIIYIPSQRKVMSKGNIIRDKTFNISTLDRKIDHITFHKSGTAHVVFSDSDVEVLEYGFADLGNVANKERLEISKTGYQTLIIDTFIESISLPKTKVIINDIIFYVPKMTPFQFQLRLVSGRLVVSTLYPEVLQTKHKLIIKNGHECTNFVGKEDMDLGWESNNQDKLLHNILYTYIGNDLLQGRRIVIPSSDQMTNE
ncbi:hypothetical protein C4569_01805 [Candidatus Parcubacteria bacterium]|nr:MAG: hypothetical protein C4569_01805 [Candidatus Parcubacteria bacterium]